VSHTVFYNTLLHPWPYFSCFSVTERFSGQWSVVSVVSAQRSVRRQKVSCSINQSINQSIWDFLSGLSAKHRC